MISPLAPPTAPTDPTAENPLAALLPGFASQLGAVHGFLGTLLLGTVFSTMLYGLSVHQTYRYFQAYPKDIALLKGLVAVLFALDTVHTALSIDACYFYLVTDYFDPVGLQAFHISLKFLMPITGCTTLLAQIFYTRRVYLFGVGHILILVVAVIFMLGKTGFVIMTCVKGFQAAYLQQFLTLSRIVSSGSFGCDLITDTILTIALVVPLLRSRTGFRRTDNMIEVLILYTVNTGLATSITGLLVFIFSISMPHTFVYAALSIVSNKVYINAVMAVLNSRHALSSRMGCEVETPHLPEVARRGKPIPGPTQDTSTDSWFAPQRDLVSISLPGVKLNSMGERVRQDSSQTTTIEEPDKAMV